MTSGLPWRLAAVPVVGLVLGALVGGILGRLVMYVLVRISPEAVGRVSDDGFEMGRFTVSGSFNLLLVGGFLGLMGGVIYALVRLLLLGPAWFRLTCVAAGAGVPVGNQIVHVDGVDFTLLQPAWLSAACFVTIPALYAVALHLVVERRLLRSWPVPPTGPLPLVAALWIARAGALTIGLLSLVDLLDKVAALG
ncbi:hypothetical protein NSZ01_18270 [Nocardioides szechwanensis]|uniref:Uncharacterized protein n=1 Tax=Nocardioides szechwanensis TaxID=1005944 RepID=A0A1H0GTN2_9ACTN|nr:hypothetical protein [Nocardioides szechwanensis]GEP34059.1 hypothetical protein NSZ01_18270 [Nocardioides szechwanensis]SDO10220.1 hypothetical protein SAMN05192576_3339 [Nocardioides szechwanensis]